MIFFTPALVTLLPGKAHLRRIFCFWGGLLLFFLSTMSPALAAGMQALPDEAPPPFFHDDRECADLDTSLSRSLDYLQGLPPDTSFSLGTRSFSVRQLINSLVFFRKLLQQNLPPAELNRQIRHSFTIYRMHDLAAAASRRMLITGYYYPLFPGNLEKKKPYLHPLYKVPRELVEYVGKNGIKTAGRMEGHSPVPFWTREEIEKDGRLRGQELIWLTDPFDAFTLHIQGSGMIRLPDGTLRGVRYARNNGHPYTSVGKYLADTGRMERDKVTMDSIRRYLADHPRERDIALHQNASYIFFQWGKAGSVTGSLGQELTPGRSIAADRRWYPPGALLFLDTRQPVMRGGTLHGWQPLRRFVTVQDSGSGLTGPNRIDLFWGAGQQAGAEAGQMKEGGTAWLLLLREDTAPSAREQNNMP